MRNPAARPGRSSTILTWSSRKARPGLFQEHLILRTNDVSGSTSQLPLTVEGSVIEALLVGPSPLFLGYCSAEAICREKLIVEADRPFRVIEVTVPDDRFKATMPVEAERLYRSSFDSRRPRRWAESQGRSA